MSASQFAIKTIGKALAALCATGLCLAAGCATVDYDEPVGDGGELLSSNANSVLGFESTSNYSVTAGTSIVLKKSTNVTQGTASLSVNAHGTTTLRSAAFGVSSAMPPSVSYDLYIPAHPSSGWTGTAKLWAECASKGLAKTQWGQVDLRGKPTGKFSTLSFTVPSTSLSKLANGCSDLRLSVGVVVPTNSTGNYLFDNVQLGGPPVTLDCTMMPGIGGQPTSSFLTRVTRADLGTVELQVYQDAGEPRLAQKVVSWNDTLIYLESAIVRGDGTSDLFQQYFPPVQDLSMWTKVAGGMMTINVNGRDTVPVRVGTDPKTIKFYDGSPPPAFTIDRNLADAMDALQRYAATAEPACIAQQTPPEVLQSGGDPHLGNGGVSGSKCNGCEYACDGALLGCTALALSGSVACGPFYALCAAGAGAACVGAFEGCLSVCHRSGTDCCPVACGHEGDILNPIGGCCYAGDTCARRATDDHVALCCGPGTSNCGGSLCCLPGEQCATPTSGPKIVGPSTNGSACCRPDQINTRGECCSWGACTTGADCGGGMGCINGCCTIG